MSNNYKPALNIYSLFDNELQRMHILVETQSRAAVHNYSAAPSQTRDVYNRLLAYQDALLEMFKTHDQKIQEKIAELALTDKTE